MQNVRIIWSPLLWFNFKSFIDPNSLSFISFQCIPHESWVLFSESWSFYKLRRSDLISGGIQFCRKSELFGPPFSISILKVFMTRILCHSLDFNAFCMIHEYFSQSLFIFTNQSRGLNFCGEQILKKVRIIWSPFLYVYFKSFMDPNSSSFIIRFQYILHDSGVLFSESWNFFKLSRKDLISGGKHFAESLNYLIPRPPHPTPPSVFQF